MKVLKNLFLLVIIASALASSAFSQRFFAKLDGLQETPPNGSAGTGYGNVVVSPDGTSMTVNMGFTGLGTSATASHIHQAPVGSAGGVIFGLAGVPAAMGGAIPQQTFALSAGQLSALQSGQYYFNVHTGGFGGGEIRAQIVVPFCSTAGPIEIQATAGTIAPTAYPTLSAAFAAINAGTHQGAIDVLVCANTTEVAAAVLNSNAATPASYASVNVFPAADGVSISGAGAGGGRGLIELNGADNVTIDGDNPNTAGINRNLTINNTSIGTFHQVIRVALNTTTVPNADNNTFKNLALIGGAVGRNNSLATSTTGTENTTYGVYVGAGAVGTVSAPATIASTTATIGLGATATNLSVTNNTVTNVGRGITVQGADLTVANGLLVNNNIIGNATAGAADGVYAVGISVSGGTAQTIRGNTVYVEGWIASSASNMGIATGVFSTLTAGTIIEKNRVNRVFDNSLSGFNAWGITLSGGNNHVVRNNFVSGINNVPNSTFSTTFGVFGIRIASGTGHQAYNNSVNLTGSLLPGSTSTALSAALGITATTLTGIDIRNNALVNVQAHPTAAAPASSAMVALYLPSAATVAMNLTLNNNDYFTGGAVNNGVGQAGVTAGTNFFTLANFDPTTTAPATNMRAYTNPLSVAATNDNASIKVDPGYASASDLHVGAPSPLLNVGATIASVTDDIDNDVRPLQAVYDIGADERLAVSLPGDFRFSSATYAGNEGTTVTVTVQRFNGSSGAVSVQYAVTNGTATGGVCGSGGDYVGPTAPTTLNFADLETSKTFNVMLCTDLLLDPAETVNLALSSPTGGGILGTPNTAVLTITDVPPPFSGAYTVGTGGTYPSLTNVGGIFEAMNLAGASGPVTINIISDMAGETGANPLNPIPGNPAILIKPSGAARTISGNAPFAVIRINGADNIRIDGSTAASIVGGNPVLRQLTVQNLSTSTSSGVIHIGSATESSTGNTVQNVNVLGSSPIQTLLGISVGAAGVGSQAAFNNNNTRIENCSVSGTSFGIFSSGVTLTPNTGTVITQNDLSTVAPNNIGRGGIIVINEDGVQITQNSIGGISNTIGVDTVGIGLGAGVADPQISTTAVTSGGITNAMVARNKIDGVNSGSTIGFSAVGIALAGSAGGANTIANNMISGVTGPATSPDFPAGIFVAGVTGSVSRIYYNSISMTGNRDPLGSASQMPGYGIAITGVDPTVELKNNIFYTTQTASGGGVNAKAYAIGMVTTTFVNLDSNYNDFFSSGANDGGFRSGSLGSALGTEYATVALWSAAVTDDTNSVIIGEVDPLFVNPVSNLRIPVTSPVIDKGIAVSVLDDFDGAIRSVNGLADSELVRVGGVPDLGADEFLAIPTAASASVRGRVLTPLGRGLLNATVVITNTNTGEVSYARTTNLGYFNFKELPVGDLYVINVNSKRYLFNSQSFTLSEDLTDLILTGQ
jgi:hypothetical protein